MKSRFYSSAGLAALVALAALSVSAQKLKPEEVVAKHLDSIATAEKRAELKSFVGLGEVKVTNITRKNPPAVGRLVIASTGTKSFFGMNMNSNDNPMEKIIFDGKKARIDYTIPGARSVLGTLLQSNTVMVEHGLYGGVLSTNWAMSQLAANNPKLSYSGTKKIDGVEAHVLKYSPRGGSDFDITLFFDAQTFRHVRTEYKRIASAAPGRTIDESYRQSETRFRVVEDFSDFKTVDGYTIPSKYKMLYTVSGQNGTNEISWDFDISEVGFNQPVDESTFATN